MGRPCKCRYCQTNLTTDIAYGIEIKNKKAYFCNQDHYEEYIKQEEEKAVKKAKAEESRDKFYNLICDILDVNGITNTALWSEKKEINKVFSDDVIVAFLEENKDWMKASVSKLDGGIYGKIRYVSVILRNKLGDYKPKVIVREEKSVVKVEENINDMMYEIKDVSRNKRRSLADLEDMF